MPTLLYVHGTGVRELEPTWAAAKRDEMFTKGYAFHQCSWGVQAGIPAIKSFKSIPGVAQTRGMPGHMDASISIWDVLYEEPMAELRAIGAERSELSLAGSYFGRTHDSLRARATEDAISEPLQRRFAEAGLAATLGPARMQVANSLELHSALQARLNAAFPAEELARCIVVSAMVRTLDSTPSECFFDASMRDALVQALLSEWQCPEVRGVAGEALWRTAASIVSPFLRSFRGSLMVKVAPTIGDILLYQSKGEKIRACIQEAIRESAPPVVLLGHSLGGIACVDLVARSAPPEVQLLVTVGSQAPFLFEIGALANEPLPQNPLFSHRRWINIYDKRDLLAFVGAELMPDMVEDVQVDNNQPFPYSHWSYWDNKEVWEIIFSRALAVCPPTN